MRSLRKSLKNSSRKLSRKLSRRNSKKVRRRVKKSVKRRVKRSIKRSIKKRVSKRRTSRRNLRGGAPAVYESGDQVYYKGEKGECRAVFLSYTKNNKQTCSINPFDDDREKLTTDEGRGPIDGRGAFLHNVNIAEISPFYESGDPEQEASLQQLFKKAAEDKAARLQPSLMKQ